MKDIMDYNRQHRLEENNRKWIYLENIVKH